jgi:hypothetical protein
MGSMPWAWMVARIGQPVLHARASSRSDLKSSDIPAWMRQAVSAIDLGATNYTIYIDNQDLLRRVTVAMHMSVGSIPVMLTEMTLKFSICRTMGSPFTATAPPADQVISLQQFLQDAGSTQPT